MTIRVAISRRSCGTLHTATGTTAWPGTRRYSNGTTDPPQPQLLDRQDQLLVLIAHRPTQARLREADEEDQRIAGDRTADLRTPVLTWPQLRGIPPHRDARLLQDPFQPINTRRVLADIGTKHVPARPSRLAHGKSLRRACRLAQNHQNLPGSPSSVLLNLCCSPAIASPSHAGRLSLREDRRSAAERHSAE